MRRIGCFCSFLAGVAVTVYTALNPDGAPHQALIEISIIFFLILIISHLTYYNFIISAFVFQEFVMSSALQYLPATSNLASVRISPPFYCIIQLLCELSSQLSDFR